MAEISLTRWRKPICFRDQVGDLASIVRQASHFYEHKLGLGLDRLMGAIGPATIVVVSVVIGTLIVSIMSALLSITELAQ
jgi:general secretion pathway protein F